MEEELKKISAQIQKNIEEEVAPKKPYIANLDVMYFFVFLGIGEYFDFNAHEILVFSFIWSFQRKKRHCYASKELLARVAFTSETTVYKILKHLKGAYILEQYFEKRRVCLRIGPKGVDRIRYVEGLMKRSKDGLAKSTPIYDDQSPFSP